MKVMTWNVLHRVHGENHREPAILRWPDERQRASAVAARTRRALEEGSSCVLLQEVSGDTLAAIRAALPEAKVINHPLARMPRPDRGGARDMTDYSEHLVVVASAGQILRGQTYDDDRGKGFLAVELSPRLAVVCTHLSFDQRGRAQLAVLRAFVERYGGEALVLAGDFNARRDTVVTGLGPFVAVSALPPGPLRTRPEPDGSRGEDIDHVAARGMAIVEARVLDELELSDHRPVIATVM